MNFCHTLNVVLSVIFFISNFHLSSGITCYECTSSQGSECKYTATSCQYGLFGCVKIAVYNGGVDKMGNFYDGENHIVSMIRGCSIIPFGGADMCEQYNMFGARVVKCTCFNDYCNTANITESLMLVAMICIIFLYVMASADYY